MSNEAIYISGDFVKVQSQTLLAGQTPKPGQLVKLNSAGTLTAVHTQGDPDEKLVVVEDALQGKTVSDAYTAGTVCDYIIPAPGAKTQALIVAGEDIAIGDKLMVSAAGKLMEVTDVNTDATLAIALEAADLTDSTAVDTLIKVRWL